MSYTWFKLHHDLPGDIKIKMFTPQEKWAWVALLCLASQGKDRGEITADNDDIAGYCEFNCTQDWLYFRDKLISKGMLEFSGTGSLKVIHWEDRQYGKPSDRPEAIRKRVSEHRTRKKSKDETPCNALHAKSNADVTPQTRLDLDLDLENLNKISTDQNEDRLRDRDRSSTSKKQGKLPSGFYATLDEPEKFESTWKWYCRKLKTVPADPKTGRKPNPGSKLEAAKRWKKCIEATGLIMEFREGAINYDFSQLGIPHFCRFISDEFWRIGLESSDQPVESDGFMDDSTNDIEDLRSQIGAELIRLNRSGVLPDDWQQNTGCLMTSELGLDDSQSYLKYLKGLEAANAD